jgi:hypothetical protein
MAISLSTYYSLASYSLSALRSPRSLSHTRHSLTLSHALSRNIASYMATYVVNFTSKWSSQRWIEVGCAAPKQSDSRRARFHLALSRTVR